MGAPRTVSGLDLDKDSREAFQAECVLDENMWMLVV